VLGWELAQFDTAVDDVFGFRAVQVGLPEVDFLRQNRIPFRFSLALEAGAGVAADPLQRDAIFALRFRGSAVGACEGSGLGLAIVRRTLERRGLRPRSCISLRLVRRSACLVLANFVLALLLAALLAGEYCYVLNARQMGKSSLCVRTMARLRDAGVRTAFIDLTRFGKSNLTAEQWDVALLSESSDPLATILNNFGCKFAPPNGLNLKHYCNPAVDALAYWARSGLMMSVTGTDGSPSAPRPGMGAQIPRPGPSFLAEGAGRPVPSGRYP